MPAEISQPFEALSISDILKALEIDCGAAAEEPEPYSVIPGNNGPRWLVPAVSRGAASVLSAWRPYSLTGKVKWLAIRMAALAGIVRLFPSVSSLTIPRTSSRRWFERCGIAGQAGEMVVMVGNPSPDRKLTVFLLDAAHHIAAVLKVGLTPGGRLSVIHEAEVLRELERYCWAPDLLAVLPDLGAAAQEYVRGVLPERGFRPEYLDLLCRLPQSGASLNLTDLAGAMERRLRPFADELDRAAPGLLGRCLSCLDLDKDMPTILAHGDFAPWNIRKTSDSGYVLIDWEWADFAGLPMHDLLHFHFSESRLLDRGRGGYAAIQKKPVFKEYLTRMGLDTEPLPRLAIAYLLERLESYFKYRDSAAISYTLNQLGAVIDSL
ncbi:MAG: phosphotransferase [Terracidiphilus sp.]|jgi:hypothetical protein